MERRHFLKGLAGLAALPLAAPLLARIGDPDEPDVTKMTTQEIEKLEKSEAEWREILTEQEFAVLREEATERAGTSPLNEEKRAGTFICAGCFLPLFESRTKFESGTGWPSFYDYIPGHLETKRDFRLIWPRTEYHCIRCEGHQGHVFNDGPPPTGKRYCNNGVALDFVPQGEPLPPLRP